MRPRPYITFSEVKVKISIPEVLHKLNLLDQFTEKRGVYTGVCPLPQHKHGPQPNDQQFKIKQNGDLWLWHCFGGRRQLTPLTDTIGRDDRVARNSPSRWRASSLLALDLGPRTRIRRVPPASVA